MTNLLNRKMDFIHSVDDRFHNFLKMDTSYPVKLNGLVQKMFIATADYRIKDDNSTATPYSSEITFSIQNSTGDVICNIKHEDVYGIDGKHLSDKAFITGDYVMALIDLENNKIFIFSFCNASNVSFNGIRELDYKCNGKDDNVILPSIIEFFNNFNYAILNGGNSIDSSEFKANISTGDLSTYIINSTVRINVVGKFGIDYSKTKLSYYSNRSSRFNRASIMTINSNPNNKDDSISYDKNIDIVVDWSKCSIPRILYNNHTCAAMYNITETFVNVDNTPIYYDFFKSGNSDIHTGGAHFVDPETNKPIGNLFPRRLTFVSIEGYGSLHLTFDNFNLTTFGSGIYIEDEGNKDFTLNNSKITISDNMYKYKYVDTSRVVSLGYNQYSNTKFDYCGSDYNPGDVFMDDYSTTNMYACLLKPRFVGPAINVNSAKTKVNITNSKIVSDKRIKTYTPSLIVNSSSNMRITDSYIENLETHLSLDTDKVSNYPYDTVPVESDVSYISRYISPLSDSGISTLAVVTNNLAGTIVNGNNGDVYNDSTIKNYNEFEAYIAQQLFYDVKKEIYGTDINICPSPNMFIYCPAASDVSSNVSQAHFTENYKTNLFKAVDNLKYYNFTDVLITKCSTINVDTIKSTYGGECVLFNTPVINENDSGVSITANNSRIDCKVNNAYPDKVFAGSIKNIPVTYNPLYIKSNYSSAGINNRYANTGLDQDRLTQVSDVDQTTNIYSNTFITSGIYALNKETEFMPRLIISDTIINSPAVLYQESADTTINSCFINSVSKLYNNNPINVVSGTFNLTNSTCVFDTREVRYFNSTLTKTILELAFIRAYNPTIRDMGDDKSLGTTDYLSGLSGGHQNLQYKSQGDTDISIRNSTSLYRSVVMLTTPVVNVTGSKITLLPGIYFNCPSFDSLGSSIEDYANKDIIGNSFNRSTRDITTNSSSRFIFRHSPYINKEDNSYKYIYMEPINSSNKNVLSFISSAKSRHDDQTPVFEYELPYNEALSTKIKVTGSDFSISDSFSYSEAMSGNPKFMKYNLSFTYGRTISNANVEPEGEDSIIYDSYGVVVRVGFNAIDKIFHGVITGDTGSETQILFTPSVNSNHSDNVIDNYSTDIEKYSNVTGWNILQGFISSGVFDYNTTTSVLARKVHDGVVLPTKFMNILLVNSSTPSYPDSISIVYFKINTQVSGTAYSKHTIVLKHRDLSSMGTNDVLAYYCDYRVTTETSFDWFELYKRLGYFNYLEAYTAMAYLLGDYSYNQTTNGVTSIIVANNNDPESIWDNIAHKELSEEYYTEHIYIAPITPTNIHQTALYQFDYLSDMSRYSISGDTIRKKFATFGIIGFRCYNTNFIMDSCQVGSINNTGYARNTYGVETLVKRAPRIACDFSGNGNYRISNSNINAWATTIWSTLDEYAKDVIEQLIPNNTYSLRRDHFVSWRGTEYPVDFTTFALADYGSVKVSNTSLVNFSAFVYDTQAGIWQRAVFPDSVNQANNIRTVFQYAMDVASMNNRSTADVYNRYIDTPTNSNISEFIINGNEMPLVFIYNKAKAISSMDNCSFIGNETIVLDGRLTVSNSNYVNITNAKAFYVDRSQYSSEDIGSSVLTLKGNNIVCIKNVTNDYYVDRYKGYFLVKKTPFIRNLSDKGMDKYNNIISPIHVTFGNIVDCQDNDILFTVDSYTDGYIKYSNPTYILAYDYKKLLDNFYSVNMLDSLTWKNKYTESVKKYCKGVANSKFINFTNNRVKMYLTCPYSTCIHYLNKDKTFIVPDGEERSIIGINHRVDGGMIEVSGNDVDNKIITDPIVYPYSVVTEYYDKFSNIGVDKINMYSRNKFDIISTNLETCNARIFSVNKNVSLMSPDSLINSRRLIGNYFNTRSFVTRALQYGWYNHIEANNPSSIKYGKVETVYPNLNTGSVFEYPYITASNEVLKYDTRFVGESINPTVVNNDNLITTCHTPLLYISQYYDSFYKNISEHMKGNVYINVTNNNINNYEDTANSRVEIINQKVVGRNLELIDLTTLCDVTVPESSRKHKITVNTSNNNFTRTPRSIVMQPYNGNVIIPFVLNPKYKSYKDGAHEVTCYGYSILAADANLKFNDFKFISMDNVNNIELDSDLTKYISCDPTLNDNQKHINNNYNTEAVVVNTNDNNTYDILVNTDLSNIVNNYKYAKDIKLNLTNTNSSYTKNKLENYYMYPTLGALKQYREFDAYNYIDIKDNSIISFPSILSMVYASISMNKPLDSKLFTEHEYSVAETKFNISRYGEPGNIIKRYDINYIPLMLFPTRDETFADNSTYSSFSGHKYLDNINNAKYNGLRIVYVNKDDISRVVSDNLIKNSNVDVYKKNYSGGIIFNANDKTSGSGLKFLNYNSKDVDYTEFTKMQFALKPPNTQNSSALSKFNNTKPLVPVYYPMVETVGNKYLSGLNNADSCVLIAKKVTKYNGSVTVSGPNGNFNLLDLTSNDGSVGFEVDFGSLYYMPTIKEHDLYQEGSVEYYVPTIKFGSAFKLRHNLYEPGSVHIYNNPERNYDVRQASKIAIFLANQPNENSTIKQLVAHSIYMRRINNLFTPYDITITNHSGGGVSFGRNVYSMGAVRDKTSNKYDVRDVSTNGCKLKLSNNSIKLKNTDNTYTDTTMDVAYSNLITTTYNGSDYVYLGYFEFDDYVYRDFGSILEYDSQLGIDKSITSNKIEATNSRYYIMDYQVIQGSNFKRKRRVHMIKNGTGRIIMKTDVDTANRIGVDKNINITKLLTDTSRYSDYVPFENSGMSENGRRKVRGDVLYDNNNYQFLYGKQDVPGIMPYHNQIMFDKELQVFRNIPVEVTVSNTLNNGEYITDIFSDAESTDYKFTRYNNRYIFNVRSAATIARSLSKKTFNSNCFEITEKVFTSDLLNKKYTAEEKDNLADFVVAMLTGKTFDKNLIDSSCDKNTIINPTFDIFNGLYCGNPFIPQNKELSETIHLHISPCQIDSDGKTLYRITKCYIDCVAGTIISTFRDSFYFSSGGTVSNPTYDYYDVSGLDYNGIPVNSEFYSTIDSSYTTSPDDKRSDHIQIPVGTTTEVYGLDSNRMDNYFLKVNIYSNYELVSNSSNHEILRTGVYLKGNGSIRKNFGNESLINSSNHINICDKMSDSYYVKLIDLCKIYKFLAYPDKTDTTLEYFNNVMGTLYTGDCFYNKVKNLFHKDTKYTIHFYNNNNLPLQETIDDDHGGIKTSYLPIVPNYILNHCPIYTINNPNMVKDTIPNVMSFIFAAELKYDDVSNMNGDAFIKNQIYDYVYTGKILTEYIYDNNITLNEQLDQDSVINYRISIVPKIDQNIDDEVFNNIIFKSVKAMDIDVDNHIAICTFDSSKYNHIINDCLTENSNIRYYNLVIPFRSITIDNGNPILYKFMSMTNSTDGIRILGQYYRTMMRGIKTSSYVLDATSYIETEFNNTSKTIQDSEKNPINLKLNNMNINVITKDNNANLI